MKTPGADSPVWLAVKKGLGAFHARTSPADLKLLGLGWYYNWRPCPKIAPADGLEFVPMFWNSGDVSPENLAAVRGSGATHVLGFNEPDMSSQANMSPKECLEWWPQLMELPQRLGSPAPADARWLERFMPEADQRGLRVDFVCVHRYPDLSGPDPVGEVEAMLTDTYRKYGRPVWLTECGAADVGAWGQPQISRPTAASARAFLKKLLAMLEGLPFVERYAWFADRVGEEYRFGSLFDPRSERLTPMGRIYREGASRLGLR